MRVVVDSSVLIDHLRGDPRSHDVLSGRVAQGDELWGIVIARAEVLAGMRHPEQRRTLILLNQLRWLEIDVDLADAAGAMARSLRRSHPGPQLADCLIAAGTERLGAALLTQNVRHFPMLPGLTPAYPAV